MRSLREIFGLANQLVYYIFHKLLFKSLRPSDKIICPIIITPKCIELEGNVYIGHHARIQGINRYGEKVYNPIIHICEGCSIQQNLHLTCANSIYIGENTAIAANVTITDINHPYEDINIPIEFQDIEVKDVRIESDCKIYNNVVILPGVHIGKHVIIGANSVVNRNVPDYSVVVGNPARIIKRFDFKSKQWTKVDIHE